LRITPVARIAIIPMLHYRILPGDRERVMFARYVE
jgi:hypothetical protein